MSENPYLTGNFAPVTQEMTEFDLKVTGEIPDFLDGRYLRIGPNPARGVDADQYHWFLGDGMVHGVSLADGRAQWYRNRWVRAGNVPADLGEQRRHPVGPRDYPANTNVLQHHGSTLALVESGPLPVELTDSLDTIGGCTFDGTLAYGYAAHPHEDPVTGELHAVSYEWSRGNRVDYTVLDPTGRIRKHVEVEVGGSPMMHDFGLTENYVVLYDLPVTFHKQTILDNTPRATRLLSRIAMSRVVGRNPLPDKIIDAISRRAPSNGPGLFPYRWNPEYPARIGLLPRAGSSACVQWYEIDQCYIFHTMNAFEVQGNVVVDVIRHDQMFANELRGPDEGKSTLVRLTIDRSAGNVRATPLNDHAQEFPRFDERQQGRPYRYGYSIGFDQNRPGDSILAHDMSTGSSQTRHLGKGREASEFCFVPRAENAPEGDGVLMGYVYDKAEGHSDLVILDAQTLDDVAAVHLPARIPAGFHGNWAPRE